MTGLARGFTILLAFATGAALGFVLTFIHRQYVVAVGPVDLPLGLIGAIAIVAALLLGMRLAFGERIAPVAAAAGALVGSAVLFLPGSGGALFDDSDPLGYVWMLAPTVLAIAIAGWPFGAARRARGEVSPSRSR
jgi:N-acetyl-1-D-myo-inositol-2-amino-2-deoxy-alpha-D-glucopyranoside deacetylase